VPSSKWLSACVVLGAFALAACGTAKDPAANPVYVNVSHPHHHWVLENGLRVIVYPDHGASGVVVNVRYDVGSADEPSGREGLAHLVEHLMFKGDPAAGVADMGVELDRAASSTFNATTSFDSTTYYSSVPRSSLATVLWLEAARMASPAARITQEGLTSERRVVLAEYHTRVGNHGAGTVSSVVYESLFPEGHPYHSTPIGSQESLGKTTVDDAKSFASSYYRPDNASIVLVGDIDVPTASAAVIKYFAGIPRGSTPLARKLVSDAASTPETLVPFVGKKVVRMRSASHTPRLVLAWRLPDSRSALGPSTDELSARERGSLEAVRDVALGFAARALDGRLYYKLREKAPGSVSDVDLFRGRHGAVLTVDVALADESSRERVLSLVEDEIEGFDSRLPSEGDRTSNAIVDHLRYLSSPIALSNSMQDSLSQFGIADAEQERLQLYGKVKNKDIVEAVRTHLQRAPHLEVHVSYDPDAPLAGQVVQ
jgi:predicted Zn-dependent peptidase